MIENANQRGLSCTNVWPIGQADEYMATLEAKGIVGPTSAAGGTVPDTDEGKAKACLHEVATIVLGPGRARDKTQAARILLTYTKELPTIRHEETMTSEDWLAAASANDAPAAQTHTTEQPQTATDNPNT